MFLTRTILAINISMAMLPSAYATDTDVIEVSASRGAHPLVEFGSLDLAIERVEFTPGGASVIDVNEDLSGRVMTTADLFRFDPGVYAQQGSVPSDARLSVRGSGASRRFGSRGLTLLIDGIPANSVDGSFYTRAYDSRSIDHIAVMRGANGLPWGGNQLGGAVNFALQNGRNATGTHYQAELGSFSTKRAHVSHGHVQGDLDAYIGASYGSSDGYRDNQEWQNKYLNANIGSVWGDNARSRFYLLYSDSDAGLASSLTKSDASDDPTKSNNFGPEDRDLETIRIAQNTQFDLGNTEVNLYTYYQHLDFDHLTTTGIAFGTARNLIDYETDEFGLGLRTSTEFDGSPHARILRTSVVLNTGVNEVRGASQVFMGFPPVSLKNDYDDTSENAQLYAEYEHGLSHELAVIAGFGWQWGSRERDINSGNLNVRKSDFDESYEGTTPRLGLRYQPNDAVTLYTNISRAYEIPALSEADDALSAQRASTAEIGGRFQLPRVRGELTVYSSRVQDDFIDIETSPGSFTPVNADTQRRGIESAISYDVVQKGPVDATLDGAYQWNDFEFDGGPNDGKRLPGIAEHVVTARLRVGDAGGKWLAALSAEHLSGMEVNNANTLAESDSFTVLNLSGEYSLSRQFALYGVVNNLTDKRYVNNVTINPFGGSTDPAAYSPGDERSLYVGIKGTF